MSDLDTVRVDPDTLRRYAERARPRLDVEQTKLLLVWAQALEDLAGLRQLLGRAGILSGDWACWGLLESSLRTHALRRWAQLAGEE